MLIDVGDTRLHVTERGAGQLALFVLHGGPGLDHTMFGSHLDALGDRCRLLLVDERGTGRSEPSAREAHARTQDEVAALLSDQLPFHFADPRDPRIDDMRAAMGDAVFGPDVLRAAATEGYGAIAVEDRLGDVAHPVLVLAGRHDRTCSVPAAEAMAAGLPDA